MAAFCLPAAAVRLPAADGDVVARLALGGVSPSAASQGPDGVVRISAATGGTQTGRLLRWHDGALGVDPAAASVLLGAPVVGRDGTVYCGSADGVLTALRPDGMARWSHRTGALAAAAPAVADDGGVYCGTSGGVLLALRADGSERWRHAIGDRITARPALGPDGTIYLGSWNGDLCAVAADGNRRWRLRTGTAIPAGVALSRTGVAYAGTLSGAVLAVRCADGTLLWRRETGGSVNGSPVIGADGTIYVGSVDDDQLSNDDIGYLHALAPDGTRRWRLAVTHGVAGTPALTANGTVVFGGGDGQIRAVAPDGTVRWSTSASACVDTAPLLTAAGTICVASGDGVLHVLACAGGASAADWPSLGGNPGRTGQDPASSAFATILAEPVSTCVARDARAELSVAALGSRLDYQWQCNGRPLAGANGPSLVLPAVQPADAGLYAAVVTASAAVATDPVVVGLVTTTKTTGAADEVGANIVHPNGNVYDQVLLAGAAATITADPGQVTRVSFIDLTDDIVQVEFSGAGSLTLVLDGASGPAAPVNYNQPGVTYLKGHAGLVIAGANETTNVSVFSVGRVTAVNQGLFRAGTDYDGLADLAFIAISSANGRFGGVRAANASFFASRGVTGLYAPGVQFTGPVYLGDIDAWDDATPVLRLGSAAEVRLTGGDLHQENGRSVDVSGVTALRAADGTTSHGVILAARPVAARLVAAGIDVTAAITVNPAGPGPADTVKYGVHYAGGDAVPMAERLARLGAIGAESVRLTFGWDWMEPVRGTIAFDGMDRLIDACRAANLEPLLVIAGSPAWANGSPDPMAVPTAEPEFAAWLANYRQFVRALAGHYLGRVTHWELWNEPNVVTFWKPAPNIDAYVRWATAMESELRAVDPTARIAFGSVTCLQAGGPPEVISGRDFLAGLYARHVRPRVVSVHPYPDNNAEPEAAPGPDRNVFRDVETIRQLLLAHGGAETEVWITEYCWWAGPSYFNPRLSLTEDQQADYYRRSLALVRSWPYVKRALWFWDWDEPGSEFAGAGLIRTDGTLRPAAQVLKSAPR